MSTKQKTAAGVASVVAMGVAIFLTASAQAPAADHQAASFAQGITPLNSRETPPELTWDMIYGDLTPPSWAPQAASSKDVEKVASIAEIR